MERCKIILRNKKASDVYALVLGLNKFYLAFSVHIFIHEHMIIQALG